MARMQNSKIQQWREWKTENPTFSGTQNWENMFFRLNSQQLRERGTGNAIMGEYKTQKY